MNSISQKLQALRSCGALNPHPEKVRHPSFAGSVFLDPHDMVQLKYEMIRSIEVDGNPVTQAAAEFGLSRPTVYEALENFRAQGVEGLLPQKRGPKNPRKLTEEVIQYLRESRASEPDIKVPALVEKIRERFGIVLHSRTVEKALLKKGLQKS
jgi:transposase